LQKDPKRRFRDIRDASLDIEDVQTALNPDRLVEEIPRRRWQRPALASAFVLITLIAAVQGLRLLRTIPVEPERRFEINMPSTKDAIRGESALAAISPGGLRF